MGQAEAAGAKLVEVPNLFADSSAVVAHRIRFRGGLDPEVVSGFQAAELRSLVQVIRSQKLYPIELRTLKKTAVFQGFSAGQSWLRYRAGWCVCTPRE